MDKWGCGVAVCCGVVKWSVPLPAPSWLPDSIPSRAGSSRWTTAMMLTDRRGLTKVLFWWSIALVYIKHPKKTTTQNTNRNFLSCVCQKGTVKELDQGSLHPSTKQPETDMSRPVTEYRSPASQAGNLPKSYLDILLICLFWAAA